MEINSNLTSIAQNTTSLKKNNLKIAITYSLLSALSFSIMTALIKSASSYSSSQELIFFRFLIGLIYLFIIVKIRNFSYKKIFFSKKLLKLNITRAVASTVAIFSTYCSLRYLPLLDVTLLVTTYPLFILLISLLFLKSRTSFLSIVSIIGGFIGITMVLQPGKEIFSLISILPLLSSVAMAVSFILMCKLSKKEHPYSIMLYYFITAEIISIVLLIRSPIIPSLKTVFISFPIGILGTIYQEFLTRSFFYASSKIVSSIMYATIIFSGLLGLIFWGYIPTASVFIGMLLIIICLYSMLANEKRLAHSK